MRNNRNLNSIFPTTLRIKVIALMVIVILSSQGCNFRKPGQTPLRYEPAWESLKQHQLPEWFMDAKFGIYFHWGAYTVPAFGHEWYPEAMYDKLRWYEKNEMHEYHMKTYGDPSEFGYHDFIPMFKAELFDADDWADLFVRAGAKFAGPVAEHHDGFAMWDSKVTTWNVGERGPKRDLMGELEKAIRKRDMKFITTFHHSRNHTRETEPGIWEGYYKFLAEHYPQILEDPERAILYGYVPEEQFISIWKDKLFEVIDKYQPDIMWFDAWLSEVPEKDQLEYLAYYFNKSLEWNREVVVTCKQHDLPPDIAVEDFERGRANQMMELPWLTDDAISRDSWSYVNDLKIKKPITVVHELIDIVSKNGILLLDISPRSDGIIPDDQRNLLLELGRWLTVNGEAIYNTRPWLVFGEGPSRLEKGGSFSGDISYSGSDIRYTRSKDGSILYAIALGWPTGNSLTLRNIKVDTGSNFSVSLLGYDSKIQSSVNSSGQVVIEMPVLPEELRPGKYAYSFRIQGEFISFNEQ